MRCFTVTNKWIEWLKVKERLAVEVKKIVEGNGASFAFPKYINLCGGRINEVPLSYLITLLHCIFGF